LLLFNEVKAIQFYFFILLSNQKVFSYDLLRSREYSRYIQKSSNRKYFRRTILFRSIHALRRELEKPVAY